MPTRLLPCLHVGCLDAIFGRFPLARTSPRSQLGPGRLRHDRQSSTLETRPLMTSPVMSRTNEMPSFLTARHVVRRGPGSNPRGAHADANFAIVRRMAPNVPPVGMTTISTKCCTKLYISFNRPWGGLTALPHSDAAPPMGRAVPLCTCLGFGANSGFALLQCAASVPVSYDF